MIWNIFLISIVIVCVRFVVDSVLDYRSARAKDMTEETK